jgi:hypothetical protein
MRDAWHGSNRSLCTAVTAPREILAVQQSSVGGSSQSPGAYE